VVSATPEALRRVAWRGSRFAYWGDVMWWRSLGCWRRGQVWGALRWHHMMVDQYGMAMKCFAWVRRGGNRGGFDWRGMWLGFGLSVVTCTALWIIGGMQ
jgi:hypothetical protein